MKPAGLIILTLLITFAKAYFDYYRIEKLKRGIYHGLEITLTIGLYIILGWLAGANDFYSWTIVMCFCGALHFAIFDAILNKLRKKPLFYLGGTSWFDSKLHGLPYPQFKIFSLVCAIGIAFIMIKSGIHG